MFLDDERGETGVHIIGISYNKLHTYIASASGNASLPIWLPHPMTETLSLGTLHPEASPRANKLVFPLTMNFHLDPCSCKPTIITDNIKVDYNVYSLNC